VNIVEVECEDTDAYLCPERKTSITEEKGVDGVVNLARKSVAVAWTPEEALENKRQISISDV
jgi:hypothetical protein